MFCQQLSRYYDQVFPYRKDAHEFLLKYLPLHGRILDAACGTGTYSLALAQRAGLEIVGVDLAPAMIVQAQSKAEDCPNVTLIRK